MSAFVALLFVLQSVSIGYATGAMAEGGAGLFGAICSVAKAAPSNSDPSPQNQHHVGPCCILHGSSAIEADVERASAEILPREAPPVLPASIYVIDASISAPELRPLSPRAPPARFV